MKNKKTIEWSLEVPASEILQSMPDAVVTTDRQMRINYFNRVASEITEFSPQEAVGMYCKDVLKSDICETECLIKKALHTRQNIFNVETFITTASRKKISILINASLVTDSSGEVVGYLCVFRDVMVLRKMMSDLAVSRDNLAEIIEQLEREIEDRRRAAKALQESEAQKQAILDASVDMIMQVDTGMRIVWANKKAAAVVNKTPEDLIGHTCHKFFQNADSPCPGCPCKKALETGNIEHGIMYQPAMNAVGESYWEDFGVPVKDESDKVVGVIEIARNVTEKIKAEQALTRAKKDWENTFDAITDIVMVLDKEHRILRANRATAHRLHMAEESLLGKKCYEVIHEERHPIDGCPLSYTAKTLEPQTAEVTVPNLRKIFICSTSPVWDDERNLTGYKHTLRDVTERKRLEAKFQQAQKLK
ncbi:MAG: PAS domain-containing protein, partial [Desulfobacterales bacterium]